MTLTNDPFPAILMLPSTANFQVTNGNIQLNGQLSNSRDRVGPTVVRTPTSRPSTSTTTVPKKKLTILKVQNFDDLKIKVKDLTRATDFFEALGASEPLEAEDGGRERRPSRVKFTDQANCEPENRTIDLINYTSTIDDPTVAIFPRCVRVQRCGGCCYPQHLFDCLPTKTSIKKVVRGMVKLNSAINDPNTGRRRRESAVMETIDIEVHEACRCQCKVMESDCVDDRHVYRPETCSCQCLNQDEELNCVQKGFSHVWDAKDCVCKCRHRRHCSTGLVFDENDCDCVLP